MMLSGKLSVGSLVAELVKAGRLSDSDAKLIQVSARQLLTQGQSQHALEVIAAARWFSVEQARHVIFLFAADAHLMVQAFAYARS